ncbi:MAG: translocation/assembly module TamB domain-containing protein, partial [Prevotella sp.]|nr:translocation/assembly module TamB domain-containing protein [Prevotella sp.]
DNPDVLQDLTLSLNKLDLAQLTSVLPYFPSISGIVNGDYHIEQNTEHLTVSSSMGIDKLTYEGNTMGDLGLEFVYMPTDEGGHYVDGILSVNEEEVGTIGGIYQKDGTIEATANLTRLPMSLVNGFIPNQVVGLQGYGEGELAITGPLSSPIVNGELKLDSCHLVSVPYGMDLKFSDRPITIADSRVKFNNYEMYAHNNNPMRITGDIDFSNLDRMTMNLRMIARQFLLIDTKENNKSIAYGKAFVNFFGNLSGPVENLLLRGKLDVLGTTDMSYILRDSPLTTDNQLDELVKFTDFSDTTQTIVSRPQLTGFNMDLTVDITQGAHVMAYLNADKSNYVDLMGGGTLRMMYNPTDNLRLTGKYTLNNGEMKYSLPIIPLKTFTIQDGSYIEFTGDMMNPKLNITATERTKATVTGTNGVGHSVDFDCGVIITKTLKDMGLEFTLDSPEDLTLHNELMSMSKEQRGKLAVTMLTTGMYLADGNTSGFSMNSALSSFLESEISNITGNALRTLDLSIGLDNTTDASGGFHTDYSFKFAKRFWNNRLKISVGGKVSTGSQMPNQNASIFDNVSMEYRLDDTANKYIKLFFNNNAYDWLEGYTQEYGGGFIWRRTIQHFKDIFRLKDDSNRMPSRPADTTKVVRPDTLNAVKRENP